MVDFYQAGSFVSYLSREYGVANVMIYNWIKESSHVQVSDTEEMTLKEWIVNTFSDNFFKGMFFKFFWC